MYIHRSNKSLSKIVVTFKTNDSATKDVVWNISSSYHRKKMNTIILMKVKKKIKGSAKKKKKKTGSVVASNDSFDEE